MEQRETDLAGHQAKYQPAPLTRFGPLIGESPAMREVYRLAEHVLSTATTVLLTGESGTGKELVARVIHSAGARSKGPFVAINCAAIPETLLEAELFGYEKGAFTGAVQRKPGRFELAGGGTLFLDEIGETSPALQAKLLRVLQEKQFERLGGTATQVTDSRIIAATNRELRSLITEGRFREDLFYRLNVYPIPLPPLRERPEDVLPLALHFLKKSNGALGKEVSGFSPEVQALLCGYHWPGNIRELENIIERAVILCQGSRVSVHDLPLCIRQQPSKLSVSGAVVKFPLRCMTLAELEKQCIVQALQQANYNRLQASKLLGLSRTQLRTRMKNHGLGGGPGILVRPEEHLKQGWQGGERRGLLLQ
jgi:two-component system NtrC family response regulator